MPPAHPPDLADLDIRRVPVADLRPDPRNARVHTQRNLDTIEESLRQFGLRKPLVVTADMTVCAGNGTLEVIRDRLGWDTVWVSVYHGTPEQARAYGVADNRTGELATWDERLLAEALGQMDSELLAAAGYRQEELDDILAAATAQQATGSQYGEPDYAGQVPYAGLDNLAARYEDKATRHIFFEFPNALFGYLIDALGTYREKHNLPSNAAAFVGMVEEITGTPAPAEEVSDG